MKLFSLSRLFPGARKHALPALQSLTAHSVPFDSPEVTAASARAKENRPRDSRPGVTVVPRSAKPSSLAEKFRGLVTGRTKPTPVAAVKKPTAAPKAQVRQPQPQAEAVMRAEITAANTRLAEINRRSDALRAEIAATKAAHAKEIESLKTADENALSDLRAISKECDELRASRAEFETLTRAKIRNEELAILAASQGVPTEQIAPVNGVDRSGEIAALNAKINSQDVTPTEIGAAVIKIRSLRNP